METIRWWDSISHYFFPSDIYYGWWKHSPVQIPAKDLIWVAWPSVLCGYIYTEEHSLLLSFYCQSGLPESCLGCGTRQILAKIWRIIHLLHFSTIADSCRNNCPLLPSSLSYSCKAESILCLTINWQYNQLPKLMSFTPEFTHWDSDDQEELLKVDLHLAWHHLKHPG